MYLLLTGLNLVNGETSAADAPPRSAQWNTALDKLLATSDGPDIGSDK